MSTAAGAKKGSGNSGSGGGGGGGAAGSSATAGDEEEESESSSSSGTLTPDLSDNLEVSQPDNFTCVRAKLAQVLGIVKNIPGSIYLVVLFVQVVLEKFRCKWKNEVGVRRDDDNDQSSIVPVADVEEFDTVKRVRIFLSALFLMLTFSRRF